MLGRSVGEGGFDPWQRLRATAALELFREIVRSGSTVITDHATGELAADDLQLIDCLNVLHVGWIDERADDVDEGLEGLRYRVRTRRITVVVELVSVSELVVVTAWRNEK